MEKSNASQLKGREKDTLETPTDLGRDTVMEISSELRQLLADVFALYVKTKNFHWHMSWHALWLMSEGASTQEAAAAVGFASSWVRRPLAGGR
jgi:hypothetical protein